MIKDKGNYTKQIRFNRLERYEEDENYKLLIGRKIQHNHRDWLH